MSTCMKRKLFLCLVCVGVPRALEDEVVMVVEEVQPGVEGGFPDGGGFNPFGYLVSQLQ